VFGRYRFAPEEVVSLNKYGLIPLVGRGVRIRHSIREYPSRIVFWCFGSPERLIERIRETGFLPSGRVAVEDIRSGSPVRWQALLVMVVLWNILFLLDGTFKESRTAGPGVLAALFLFTLVPLGIRHCRPVRKIFLKEGRDPGEIGAWLNFLPALTGTMFIILLALYFFGAG